MICEVVNCYLSGAAVVTQFGALAYNSGAVDPSAGLPCDTESYDTTGWHDTSSNSERMTVPSGVSYVRAIARIDCSGGASGAYGFFTKGGSSFPGTCSPRSDTSGNESFNGCSAIVAVTAGNYFRFDAAATASTASVGSWLAIEKIDSATKMALVQKTTGQAISAGTTTTVTWNTEVTDTDAWHDNSTNNSRLTVPSGVSLVRVSASLRHEDTTGTSASQFVLNFLKNGASVPGLPARDHPRSALGNYLHAASAILAVSAGDFFECQAFTTEARTIQADDASWFQIEEIPAGTKYALVNKVATQALSAATFAAVAFGTSSEIADTNSFHDNVTNNSRLTVPSGVTKARVSFGLAGASQSDQLIGEVRMNGTAALPGLPRQETDTAGTDAVCGFGAWVDVVAGDYFELFAYSQLAQTLPISDRTWFCIECV